MLANGEDDRRAQIQVRQSLSYTRGRCDNAGLSVSTSCGRSLPRRWPRQRAAVSESLLVVGESAMDLRNLSPLFGCA